MRGRQRPTRCAPPMVPCNEHDRGTVAFDFEEDQRSIDGLGGHEDSVRSSQVLSTEIAPMAPRAHPRNDARECQRQPVPGSRG